MYFLKASWKQISSSFLVRLFKPFLACLTDYLIDWLITGSNGKEYMFLLKGHEDMRQDERVMQLFGLVNFLLVNNPETFRRNLT